MRDDGFPRLRDVRAVRGFERLDVTLAAAVVRHDRKGRFALVEEAGGEWWVRANQGHTLKCLDDDKLLTRVARPSALPICVHGTSRHAWPSILTGGGGLFPMARNLVHFAAGVLGSGVVSGMRRDCDLYIYVDVARAMAARLEFYVSANQSRHTA